MKNRYHLLLSSLLFASGCMPQATAATPNCPPEATAPTTSTSSTAPNEPRASDKPTLDIELAQYAFLLGQWETVSGGAHGPFSFEPDVAGRVIVRHHPTPTTGNVHEDLLTIYLTEKGDVRALYVDKWGHVIEYAVSVTDNPKSVEFVSKADPGQTRYRLAYELLADGSIRGRSQTAPPGKTEFSGYMEWTAKKK